MFRIYSGKTRSEMLPMTPSTEISRGEVVTFSSGALIAATAGTAAADLVGVLDREVSSTDADYADDRLVEVQVPTERHCVWEGDVTSGLVAGDIGGEFDLTDSETVNRGASTVDAVKCVGRISGTKGYFYLKVNGSY